MTEETLEQPEDGRIIATATTGNTSCCASWKKIMTEETAGTPKFVYLLNTMEGAGNTENPYEHDYAGHRAKVLDYVASLEREVAALTTQRDEPQRDKRAYAQAWRNDALEAAAKIVHRYEGNQHCVDDILALRQSIPTNGTELRAELDAAKRALARAHPYFTAILKNRMPFTVTDILDACVIEGEIAAALAAKSTEQKE